LRLHRRLLILATHSLALFAAGALLGAGCGGDGGSDHAGTASTQTSAQTTTAPAPANQSGSNRIRVAMKEFAFLPSNVSATARQVSVTARNTGRVPHQLLLLRTNRPPGSLPTNGSRAKEDGSGAKVIGKTGDVAPGSSGKFAAKLQPGTYVMICNLPGHYRSGMYGGLTVK
jgi:uncharacterized cupredoxin-like copper-binding protein